MSYKSVIGFDPGTKNFAMGVTRWNDKGHYRIKEIGQLTATLQNLTNKEVHIKKKHKSSAATVEGKERARLAKLELRRNPVILETKLAFQDGLLTFYNKGSDLIDSFNPDAVIIERYQARGLKGSTIEAIAMMISVMSMICISRNIPIVLVTAATWKNSVNRLDDMDELYELGESKGITPHELDGVLMSIYLASKRFNLELSECLRTLRKNIDRLYESRT